MNKKDRRELIVLFLHLEQMEKAGVPVLEAMQAVANDMQNRRLKGCLNTILREMKNGGMLSEGMELFPQFFDETIVRLVRLGEKTGRMALVLGLCHNYLRRIEDLTARIRRALRRHKIAAVIFCGLAVIAPAQWGTSPFVNLAILTCYPVLFALRRSFMPFRMLTDWLAIHTYMARFIVQHSLARFAESLSLLYDAGIDLKSALDAAMLAIPNLAVRREIAKALPLVREGASLYTAFSGVKYMNSFTLGMIRAGESSGNLSATLRELVSYYDRKTEEALDALEQMLNIL